MERNEYVVVYFPFDGSDMVLESLEYGATDEDTLKEFKERHTAARVKSVTRK